ncbi:hypothetical protein [Glycomyces tritici]|uniref:Gram-positive cocci surface proteins LPxTG domain-containing protein n=1 Tax=Glycomyces tritici TaxID=2665176 RepID=A0ABT7YQM4_9ACTN|nr:hypothetical protein [Glycomyces tritici]MDN3240588.1 hypothetical protein [Glycomyces tritici]
MELKQPIKTFGVAVGASLVGALALASPAQATEPIDINPDHVGKPATYFEEGCGTDSQLPEDLGADEDGWVFVLPGGNDDFVSVTVTYEDEDGDEHVLDATIVSNGNSGSAKHAYIITPAGWTIVEASAVIEGDSKFFNVTHTCPGEPSGNEPSSPAEEPSSPGEQSSSPAGEESSPVCEEPSSPEASPSAPAGSETPCEEATSPAGNGNLPTTGTPLTIALVSAAALAAGGAAVFMIMRRRREAQDW